MGHGAEQRREGLAGLEIQRAFLFLYQDIVSEFAIERVDDAIGLADAILLGVFARIVIHEGAVHHDPLVRSEQVGFSKERLARIRPQLEKYVEENRLAGGAALIARHGKVIYFETFGVMDKESGGPMTKDAIFRIYSMTKPIVAVAALTLYEEGKFSLLDPVSKYLPEFSDMKVVVPAADGAPWHTVAAERPILILDLLRHTSGMNNRGPKDANGELIFARLDIKSHSLADGIKLLASTPLVHQPQSGFDYSPGPDVIGQMCIRDRQKLLFS